RTLLLCCESLEPPMSKLGHSRRFWPVCCLSAIPPIATGRTDMLDVGFVPKATIGSPSRYGCNPLIFVTRGNGKTRLLAVGVTMKLVRRQFLHLAAGAVALPFAPHVARAQAYPIRPVRIIVGFPPGGSTDIIARLMGQYLSERHGQPFII